MTRRAVTALVAVLLCLGGCSSDDSDPSEGPDATSKAPAAAPYAATLELLARPDASGGSSGSSSSAPPAQPGAPIPVRVTNSGSRKDGYLLRVTPIGSGAVTPEALELAPGESEVVEVRAGAIGPDEQLSVMAISRAKGGEIARLDLPAPAAE